MYQEGREMYKRVILKNLGLQDLQPRVYGIKDFAPGESAFNRRIKGYVLHYVTNGQGLYSAGAHDWPVEAGDIFISYPGAATVYTSGREQPMTYIWVSFDCVEDFAAYLEQPVISAPWAKSIFFDILRSGETAVPEWTICAGLYQFFVGLAQRQAVHTMPEADYVNLAAHYIQNNLSEDIRIADLAADLGLNRSYFCRIFKEQMGLPPQEYLVSYRLETAAELLADQGLSQKEAALRVGYSDVCSFSRMFKRKYGIAPGEYVRRSQKE